jgi:septal ring factor EnvC (AmiA/AmiB activator)
MSGAKARAEKPEEAGVPLEGIFRALEDRVESLSSRVRELAAENARLKGAVIETAAERDRLRKELDESRDSAARLGGEAAEKVSRYEAERQALRERVEKLILSLEGVEAAGQP